MIRYLETFYRHRRLVLAPTVIALVLSGAVALLQPAAYQAAARIWIDSSAQGQTGGYAQFISPAVENAQILTSLLKTRSFVAHVAARGPMAGYLKQHPPTPSITALAGALVRRSSVIVDQTALDDAAYQVISTKAFAIPTGPQLIEVDFTFPEPVVAAGTAQAIVDQFARDVSGQELSQAQAAVDYYNDQINSESKEVQVADQNVIQYEATHPQQTGPNSPPDPVLAALRQTDDLTRQRYEALRAKLDQANLNLQALQGPGGVNGAPFRVIDRAAIPTGPVSRAKTLFAAGGGALGAGLGLAVLMLLVLTVADSSIRRPEEVERLLGLPFAGSIPRLEGPTA